MAAARLWRRARALTVTSAAFGLLACSDQAPSTLRPGGPGARRVEGFWWQLFWVSAVVCVIVVIGVVLVIVRRRRAGDVSHREPTMFVVVAGVVVPFLVLAIFYGLSLRDTLRLARPDAAANPPLTIEVIGHQWWWEVRYPPGTGAVVANEIHIPVGTDVRLQLRTDDVLHSFWVPQLMPKTDMIAGRTNTTWVRADNPGTYRGQCAEYCGMQHGHMAFVVIAQPRDEFDAWLKWAGRDAAVPVAGPQQRGLNVFKQTGCAACHSIRGTGAIGGVGPDLTTIGDRWSIGAGTVPNDSDHLRQWIANPQDLKPGNAMPPQPVAPADMDDLIAYLRSLKPTGQGAP